MSKQSSIDWVSDDIKYLEAIRTDYPRLMTAIGGYVHMPLFRPSINRIILVFLVSAIEAMADLVGEVCSDERVTDFISRANRGSTHVDKARGLIAFLAEHNVLLDPQKVPVMYAVMRILRNKVVHVDWQLERWEMDLLNQVGFPQDISELDTGHWEQMEECCKVVQNALGLAYIQLKTAKRFQ